MSDRLRVALVGRISPQCQLDQQSHSATFETVQDPVRGGTQGGQLDLPFSLKCNSAFNVSLHSKEGGLRFDGRGPSDSDFQTLIPYEAVLRTPGRAGPALSCESKDMAGAQLRPDCLAEISSAKGANGPGSVRVRVPASGRPLLQGVYADTLTMRVVPVLGGEAVGHE